MAERECFDLFTPERIYNVLNDKFDLQITVQFSKRNPVTPDNNNWMQ